MEHIKFYSIISAIIFTGFTRYISGEPLNHLQCPLGQPPCTKKYGTETHTVTCANKRSINLTCPGGYFINIKKAHWGRQNDRSCSNTHSSKIANCGGLVTDLPCKEKETCRIPLVNSSGSFIFGDECLQQGKGNRNGVQKHYIETIYMYIIHTCKKASDFTTLLGTSSLPPSTTLNATNATITGEGSKNSSSFPQTSGGGAGVGVGVGIACLALIGLGAVFLYILWRRRTKYIKENEPVYLASEKDKKPSMFANLLNPLYGPKQPDQEHQYYNTREGVDHNQHDYLEVIADTADYDNNNATPDGHVEPQYETVDLDEYSSQTPGKPAIHGAVTPEYEEVDLDTPQDSATQPESIVPPSQYETVQEPIYDADYGAVDFIENDLYS